MIIERQERLGWIPESDQSDRHDQSDRLNDDAMVVAIAEFGRILLESPRQDLRWPGCRCKRVGNTILRRDNCQFDTISFSTCVVVS